jgi:hypothetical protein
MPTTPIDLKDGPTKYLDRPTNDGKHGDAADEPTEGAPSTTPPRTPESSTPGRPHDTSRQQKHGDQNLQSNSESLDERSAGGAAPRSRPPASAK